MQNLPKDLSCLCSHEMSQGPHIWQSGIIQFRIRLQSRMKLWAVLAQLLVWEQRNLHRHFPRILITTKYHIRPQLYKNSQDECNSPAPWKHALRKTATYSAPAGSQSSLPGSPHCWWPCSCSSLSPPRGSSRWWGCLLAQGCWEALGQESGTKALLAVGHHPSESTA